MLAPGTLLAKDYCVERLIGRGGQASVYEVSHLRIKRRLAAKVINADLASNSEFLNRFQREADILATLDHPHAVRILDKNVTDDGHPFLIVELLQGEDLAARLRRCGRLPLEVALTVLAQVGAAIQTAHDLGILHRDLKPSNIFLVANQQIPVFAKVLDFGIAKLLHEAGSCDTDSSVIIGTPAYMSPEQARSGSILDGRSDQYSLGSILYEMISGQPAFFQPQEPAVITLYRITYEPPAPLMPGIANPQLEKAMLQALSKLPDDRFPSVREFVAAALQNPQAAQSGEHEERSKLPATTSRAMIQPVALSEESTQPPRRQQKTSPDSLSPIEAPPSSSSARSWSRPALVAAAVLVGGLGFVCSRSANPRRPWPAVPLAAERSVVPTPLRPPPQSPRPAATPRVSLPPTLPDPEPRAPITVAAPAAKPSHPSLAMLRAGQDLSPRHRLRVYPELEGVAPEQRLGLLPCFRQLIKFNPAGKLLNKRLILRGQVKLKVQPSGELPFPVEQLIFLDDCIEAAAHSIRLPPYLLVTFRGEEVP